MSNIVEVNQLTKLYNGVPAVNSISFTIPEKSVVGLLGHNGAGKSTTMKMLVGYLAPTSGTISVLGHSVQESPLEVKRRIGYLPEQPPLYSDFTADEHLRFVCDLKGVPAGEQKAEIGRVCEDLKILNVRNRKIRNLSKGYRQRVGFAAALIGNPEFLILDEPTVGFDPEQTIEIRNLILRLSERMSVLISSHILSEISSVCTGLLFLRRGELVASGTKEEISRQFSNGNIIEITARGDRDQIEGIIRAAAPDAERTVLQLPDGSVRCTVAERNGEDLRGELFRAFSAHSSELTMLTMHRMSSSLEEIFLQIMKG